MQAQPKNARAFSLLEVVIVLIITSIMMSVAAPRVQSFIANDRIRRLGTQIVLDLTMARSEAIKRRTPIKVRFNEGGDYYEIEFPERVASIDGKKSTYRVRLDDHSTGHKAEIRSVSLEGDDQFTFDQFGTPSLGGTIVIGSGDSETSITIDQANGNVTVGNVVKRVSPP
jgi:prepilin-type N-terminal cleavage/methylation domain-containing protein